MQESDENSRIQHDVASPQDEVKDLLEVLVQEVRAIKESQEVQSKKLNSIMGEIDFITRNLSEHIYGGPSYQRELVNDDIDQEMKDLGYKRRD